MVPPARSFAPIGLSEVTPKSGHAKNRHYDPLGGVSPKKVTRVRRTFTPQFKKDAVALIRDGRSLTEVAHDLGIARSLLQHWQKQFRQDAETA